MIETPIAILNVKDIAAAAKDSETRLAGLRPRHQRSRQGNRREIRSRPRADAALAHDLHSRRARLRHLHSRRRLQRSRRTRTASSRECEQGRDLGFDGKTLIHPNQVEPCNDVFSPSADGDRAGAQDHRRLRSAGEQGQGRGLARRPHGRAHACRYRAHDCRDRGCDRGEGVIRSRHVARTLSPPISSPA